MAKAQITIDIDYHEATPALARLLELLDWAKDSYGVSSMKVEVNK